MKCLIYVGFSISHNRLRQTVASCYAATKHAEKEKGVMGTVRDQGGRRREGGKEKEVFTIVRKE